MGQPGIDMDKYKFKFQSRTIPVMAYEKIPLVQKGSSFDTIQNTITTIFLC